MSIYDIKGVPMYHKRLTDAANKIGEGAELIQQACFEDCNNPEYNKLYEAAHRLSKRFRNAWSKSVKRGRKEGWLG